MEQPNIGDTVTVEHRQSHSEAVGQVVTGEVVTVAINGNRVTIVLRLQSPKYVVGPSGKHYDRIYFTDTLD